ncbi:MAG: DUF4198 domain-containing protein [Treponema sp.]|nr:DUF4198 domain-containing protein [Treponema sp.]
MTKKMKRTGAAPRMTLWIGAALCRQSARFPDFPAGGFGCGKAMTLADMALMKLNKLTSMRFANALDGKAIAEARVEIPGAGGFVTAINNRHSISAGLDGVFRFALDWGKSPPASLRRVHRETKKMPEETSQPPANVTEIA